MGMVLHGFSQLKPVPIHAYLCHALLDPVLLLTLV
jgi:hypothetical protein